MLFNQAFAHSLINFAMLANVVVGLPAKPTGEGTSKVQDVFYSVQCEPETWGTADRCGTWCNTQGTLNFNRSRCPIGSNAADDIMFDCYCVGECAICKDKSDDQVKEKTDE